MVCGFIQSIQPHPVPSPSRSYVTFPASFSPSPFTSFWDPGVYASQSLPEALSSLRAAPVLGQMWISARPAPGLSSWELAHLSLNHKDVRVEISVTALGIYVFWNSFHQKVIMVEIPNTEINLWDDHFSGKTLSFSVQFVFFCSCFFVLILMLISKAKSQRKI